MDVLYQKKYPFVFLGIMTLTAIVFLITIDFMYGQSSGQTNTLFKIYENDIHKVKIGYSSNRKLENENSTSIVRFIAPGTGGETKLTGVLTSIFQRPNPSMAGTVTVTKQIQPNVTTPDELPNRFNVSIAEDSSFPNNRIIFAPSEINIAPNATVVWTNDDSIMHSVTSGKPREGPTGEFDSGIIQAADSFSHTFSKIGAYDYYSNLQPYMVGKVIVGLHVYNLQVNDRIYPISFLLTGNGNQIQEISLQAISPTLEIRMASASAGNLTLVIPRALLDKLEPNGNDDQFGVIANRAVGFEETSTTPTSRTLVVQFDPGVNYIQILGTKSIEPKIKQALLPSFAKTNNSKTPTNMAETTSKLQVPLTEPKPPMNDTSSQIGGSTVSIVPGSSAPSNGKYYAPETIAISKGTSVAWINDDVTLHTVTSGTPGEGNIGTEFDSSFMDAGKTFEHVFDTAGTFDYFCTLHPFMTGKVKVQ